jgi:hypothetical protein
MFTGDAVFSTVNSVPLETGRYHAAPRRKANVSLAISLQRRLTSALGLSLAWAAIIVGARSTQHGVQHMYEGAF